MMLSTFGCPIWGGGYLACGFDVPERALTVVEDSARAGGGYEIGRLGRSAVGQLDDLQKARLTTILVDQRAQGVVSPLVTEDLIEEAVLRKSLPVHERAERLLRHYVKLSKDVDDQITVQGENAVSWGARAWSESQTNDNIFYFNEYLAEMGWVKLIGYSFAIRVSVDGFSHVSDLDLNVDSSQAFVAMWLDKRTVAAYEQGIRVAIEEAGYSPMRIDRKPDLNKIDDEIIAEIRRSRFLVADFTHGEEGARGGVYFEAGFAHGLNIPVIFTCRSDMMDKLHFDTRQYAHIVWETPDQLRSQLLNRIGARIGEGPERSTSE